MRHVLVITTCGALLVACADSDSPDASGGPAAQGSGGSTATRGGDASGGRDDAGGGGRDGGLGGDGDDTCNVDACPSSEDLCMRAACDGGACTFVARDDGAPIAEQIAGDCKTLVCVGGVVTEEDDDLDVGAADICRGAACEGGEIVLGEPALPGTPCGEGVCQSDAFAGECGYSLYSRIFPQEGAFTRRALSTWGTLGSDEKRRLRKSAACSRRSRQPTDGSWSGTRTGTTTSTAPARGRPRCSRRRALPVFLREEPCRRR